MSLGFENSVVLDAAKSVKNSTVLELVLNLRKEGRALELSTCPVCILTTDL